ncbi:hypothetical protein HOK68_00645 [Candidatus Woesearchaeota archaeon]|jgi:hypothetical protein|nr:hypothetical protein [Candidatus Woesearchaeota archaeon]MBT4387082.1 hypothetical protein [Candidatus Woesearchaeota archaeon]MBT4596161.1 hypothetical protein [Candidatus Woesearchaeota archaeon]MBT5741616.1 hypothetical protein [Candidatus Woesearchaeota archaeon]MBT6505268.1 hypothetical protein [Candidatus Woesearchaeota archaeon]
MRTSLYKNAIECSNALDEKLKEFELKLINPKDHFGRDLTSFEKGKLAYISHLPNQELNILNMGPPKKFYERFKYNLGQLFASFVDSYNID